MSLLVFKKSWTPQRKRIHLRGSLLWILIALFTSSSIAAVPYVDQLVMKTTPLKGFEPLNTKTRISLEPSDNNRGICVVWTNLTTDDQRVSCRTLDGANEPKTFWYEYKKMPAGEWVIVVQIERAALKPLETQNRIDVIGVE